jgi:hypothetical protein
MTGYSFEYILDNLSLLQLMMIYEYGLEFEETKSVILVNKLAECFFGVKSKKTKSTDINEKPDLKKFRAFYGDKIKTNRKEK